MVSGAWKLLEGGWGLGAGISVAGVWGLGARVPAPDVLVLAAHAVALACQMVWRPPAGFERRKGDGKAVVGAWVSCFLLPTLLLARE
ncbi:hypothetical protein T484DRAFT_1760408, partial [Baffinella frigidus]